MKANILTGAMLICTNLIFGQKVKEVSVPKAVTLAYHGKYASASGTSWEMEDGMYEVHFKLDRIEYSVVYKTDGSVHETEQTIKITDFPKGVVEYVSKNYPKKKIAEAGKITDANGVVTYEAEVNKKDLIFDAEGKFLRKL
jgi:hypothetical protein